MGRFCTGVTLITSQDQEGPIGFACQSLQSLSLEPPMVSFAPARTSTSWPRIRDTGRFAVNILTAEQGDLCAQFAKSGGNKFAGISWTSSGLGCPLIDDVHAWLDCTVVDEFEAGDHTLVLGRVNELHADDSNDPLVYYRGGFRALETAGGNAGTHGAASSAQPGAGPGRYNRRH